MEHRNNSPWQTEYKRTRGHLFLLAESTAEFIMIMAGGAESGRKSMAIPGACLDGAGKFCCPCAAAMSVKEGQGLGKEVQHRSEAVHEQERSQ